LDRPRHFFTKKGYPQVTSSPLVVMVIHDNLFWIWGTPMAKCWWPQVFSACTVAGPHLQKRTPVGSGIYQQKSTVGTISPLKKPQKDNESVNAGYF
jgi:hypothetical protein